MKRILGIAVLGQVSSLWPPRLDRTARSLPRSRSGPSLRRNKTRKPEGPPACPEQRRRVCGPRRTWPQCGLLILSLLALTAAAKDNPAYEPGLLAHYFSDPVNWGGNWPDTTNAPSVNPTDWTFSEYQYSRVEPVVNHEFVKRGWFSVRWTGFLDTRGTEDDRGVSSAVEGTLNINPNNSTLNAFTMKLPGGATITQDDIRRQGFNGYSGTVSQITVKPKGNSDDNMLTVDGAPYPLRNKEAYDITAAVIEAALCNQATNGPAQPAGQWWLRLATSNAVIACNYDRLTPAVEAGPAGEGRSEYVFEIHADDGCRLYIDGKALIDDFVPCWEQSPRSLRRSPPVLLSDGLHEITVEYFQGQSLEGSDADPMRLYWACPRKNLPRQLVRPAHLFHVGTPDAPPRR